MRRLLLGSLAFVSAAVAAESARERSAFLRALGEAPALVAAARRVEAARARSDSAGRLADPEIEGMRSRMVGPMNERSSMWEVNLRQPLPKPGERAADRERARAVSAMAEADYALMAGEIAAEVALALAEADGARQRIRFLESQAGRLESVLRSLDTRLATGGAARLGDRLTVQTRLAALQLKIEEEQTAAANALAEARSRLGMPAEAPPPDFAAPAIAEISADAAAALQLAAARASEAKAMAKMARASARPMTAVGLRYERERTGMGDENTLGLAFSSEIPWRGRRYALADARAAEADRVAAETEATAARHRIASAISRAERAERLAATARRLGGETRSRFEAEYDALVRSLSTTAASGESNLLQLVELLEKATDTDLGIVDAETAARSAQAELWRHAPARAFPFLFATP